MQRAPVLITFATGWFLVVQYFVPQRQFAALAELISLWVPIVASVGLALGAISLVQLHGRRIASRHPHRVYSAVTLISMAATVVAGLWPGEAGERALQWLYDNLYVALRGTMFSLLAFYLASASYRAFRVRSREALLLFASAFLVMLGNVPAVGELLPWLPVAGEWVMDVPMTAAMRAIRIGVGLGMVVLSLRILLGRDRSYLGAGR